MEDYKKYIPSTMWNLQNEDYEMMPDSIQKFLADIISVCREHGFSISHEDVHGSFVIEDYSDDNMQWLCSAVSNIKG